MSRDKDYKFLLRVGETAGDWDDDKYIGSFIDDDRKLIFFLTPVITDATTFDNNSVASYYLHSDLHLSVKTIHVPITVDVDDMNVI